MSYHAHLRNFFFKALVRFFRKTSLEWLYIILSVGSIFYLEIVWSMFEEWMYIIEHPVLDRKTQRNYCSLYESTEKFTAWIFLIKTLSLPVRALSARRRERIAKEIIRGAGEKPLRNGHPSDHVVTRFLLQEFDDEAPGVLLLMMGQGFPTLHPKITASVPSARYQIHYSRVTPGCVTLSRTHHGPIHGVGGWVDDYAVPGGTVGDVESVQPEARGLQIQKVKPGVLGFYEPGFVDAVRDLGRLLQGRPGRRLRGRETRGSQTLVDGCQTTKTIFITGFRARHRRWYLCQIYTTTLMKSNACLLLIWTFQFQLRMLKPTEYFKPGW